MRATNKFICKNNKLRRRASQRGYFCCCLVKNVNSWAKKERKECWKMVYGLARMNFYFMTRNTLKCEITACSNNKNINKIYATDFHSTFIDFLRWIYLFWMVGWFTFWGYLKFFVFTGFHWILMAFDVFFWKDIKNI